MVLEELVQILANDMTLKLMLKVTKDNTKIMPSPSISDGIAFNFIPLNSDNAVRQSQLGLTIINPDLLTALKIKERVDVILITSGDNSLTSTITGCIQNGGGYYYDNDLKMYKVVANYVITERMM